MYRPLSDEHGPFFSELYVVASARPGDDNDRLKVSYILSPKNTTIARSAWLNSSKGQKKEEEEVVEGLLRRRPPTRASCKAYSSSSLSEAAFYSASTTSRPLVSLWLVVYTHTHSTTTDEVFLLYCLPRHRAERRKTKWAVSNNRLRPKQSLLGEPIHHAQKPRLPRPRPPCIN